MNTTEIKIKEATEKYNEWVEYLATRPDSNLARRLRINHQEFAIAQKQKMEDSCRLLNIMERIIIEARIYKEENNIADVPTEIEEFLEEAKLMEQKAEERLNLLNKTEKKKQEAPATHLENQVQPAQANQTNHYNADEVRLKPFYYSSFYPRPEGRGNYYNTRSKDHQSANQILKLFDA